MRIIFMVCILFSVLVGGSTAGHCASTDSPELYQETIWVSQDVTMEQRDAIDKIIQDKSPEIKKIFKQAALIEAATKYTADDDSDDTTLVNFLNVMQKMEDAYISALYFLPILNN